MSEVEALLREREGYVVRGRKDRVAQVDAELKRLGFAVETETTEAVTPHVERAVTPRGKRK